MSFFFLIVCTVCCIAPLKVLDSWFSLPPFEVGIRYRAGADCLGMRDDYDVLCGVNFIVFPFVNIALTASIADNCESQILVGTSLSAAAKDCIACVILSSAVM